MRILGVTWSSTVAGISVLSALPPHTSLAPLASASSISALQCCTVLMPITQPSTTGSGLRGSPSGSAAALATNFVDELVGDLLVDDDALGATCRSGPLLAKAPKAAAFTASSMSASSRITSGALPPSSSTTGFRYFAQVCAMMRPTRGRAGEVDAPHRRVRHHRLDHRAGVGRRVGDVVDDARRKARLLERLDDQLVRARAVLRCP